ncbi:MAG: hypothetical protein M1837_006742 [Sclerophora amabilis]|nr:MAG: hypothetical protein M1837_006742 [Sclerophora amabilis]
MLRRYWHHLPWGRPTDRYERDKTRTVDWLLEHRDRDTRAQLQHQSRQRGSPTDTPLASLYRLYVDVVDDFTIELRNEIEYFFSQSSWRVAAIPDPKDPDPARYAILSVLPHLLVPAFNRLIARGLPRDAPAIIMDFEDLERRPRVLEDVPPWCAGVPGLGDTLKIPNHQGEVLPDRSDERASPEFLVKNILAFKQHTFFV